MLTKILMITTIACSLACGGGETNKEAEQQKSRFVPVEEDNQVVGYNFTMEDGSVLFVPIDEMPPAAPDGLENGGE